MAKTKPEKKTSYSDEDKEEIITNICNDVIENKISFNEAVSESDISLVSFYQWIANNEKLQKLYKYAREVRSDVLFEEIIEIADTTEEGVVIKETERGTEIKRGDMTEHRRLRVDARKWVVAKMQPKKYGDKLEVETTEKKAIEYINVSKQFPDK